MHQALFIEEILLNIFGHCSPPARRLPERRRRNPDLAALARTCRTFKDPALDVLWEELSDLSPLVRCLPDSCLSSGKCYSLSRPPRKVEWNTLRGYTRRVWSIHGSSSAAGSLDRDAMMILFTQAPFPSSLFPNLRSLSWQDFTTFPVVHAAVPSLISLHLHSKSLPATTDLPLEILDPVGERCLGVKEFRVSFSSSRSLDAAISRQLCRWKYLQLVSCVDVALSRDAILHLSSVPTLTRLSFTLSADVGDRIARLGSVFLLPSLTSLDISSTSLQSVTGFISRIRFPVIKELGVVVSKFSPKQDVQTYWAAVQNACSPRTLAHLTLSISGHGAEHWDYSHEPWLTVNDLPCRAFGGLRTISINLPRSVKLTDADLLDLVSTSPHLEKLMINDKWGWRTGDQSGGVTLGGLVQVLQQCPFLYYVCLAIDTQTYTQIPHGLDVSFPPRETLCLDFLDSFISSALVPSLVSVFTALKLNPLTLLFSANGSRDDEDAQVAWNLWQSVRDEMEKED